MSKNAIKYGFYSVVGFIAVLAFSFGIGNFPKAPLSGTETAETQSPGTDPAPADENAAKALIGTGAQPSTDNAQPSADKTEQTQADPVPTFDTLRVEKNGSIVVAGSAKPNSKISLLTSDGAIIGEDTALASGDFVIVPDKPLPSGDYALTLRGVDPDGNEFVSEATGIVRVPKQGQNDTIAMVDQEGQASKIFVKPDDEAGGSASQEAPQQQEAQPAKQEDNVAVGQQAETAPQEQTNRAEAEEITKPAEPENGTPAPSKAQP